jgi:biopolymer transport protein ExbB/TolQ
MVTSASGLIVGIIAYVLYTFDDDDWSHD